MNQKQKKARLRRLSAIQQAGFDKNAERKRKEEELKRKAALRELSMIEECRRRHAVQMKWDDRRARRTFREANKPKTMGETW